MLVSCNGRSTSASAVETDEGVGTDDLSQFIGGSSPCQDQLQRNVITDHCPHFHISSLRQELLRKNEQLKFLKQMLKEVSAACLLFTIDYYYYYYYLLLIIYYK